MAPEESLELTWVTQASGCLDVLFGKTWEATSLSVALKCL